MYITLISKFSKLYLRNFLILLCVLFCMDQFILKLHATPSSPQILGNRVVVAVNSIPYTQLQIERYINTKETLRDAPQNSQTVNGSNWQQAVDAFVNDMAIHQEASKSSGFRPSKEAIQKLRFKIENALEQAPQFKQAFTRLGLSKIEIETEALRIATVENFRRGKSTLSSAPQTQSSQKSDAPPASQTNNKETRGSWEKDLKDRTIVRYFDDGLTWKEIQPKP